MVCLITLLFACYVFVIYLLSYLMLLFCLVCCLWFTLMCFAVYFVLFCLMVVLHNSCVSLVFICDSSLWFGWFDGMVLLAIACWRCWFVDGCCVNSVVSFIISCVACLLSWVFICVSFVLWFCLLFLFCFFCMFYGVLFVVLWLGGFCGN